MIWILVLFVVFYYYKNNIANNLVHFFFFFFGQVIFGIFFLKMMPLIQSRCIGHFANIVPVSLHSSCIIFSTSDTWECLFPHSITKKISDFEIFANLIAYFSLNIYQFLTFFFFFWYLRLFFWNYFPPPCWNKSLRIPCMYFGLGFSVLPESLVSCILIWENCSLLFL